MGSAQKFGLILSSIISATLISLALTSATCHIQAECIGEYSQLSPCKEMGPIPAIFGKKK